MGRRSSVAGPKPKKRKKVTVQLLKRQHQGKLTQPYVILDELVAGPHGHLKDAKIALAWRLGWRADADNHLTLGKLRKRGDLDRELDSFDFVILLNKEAWETLSEPHRRALVDHKLCHAELSYDNDGNPKLDDRGRLVCRVKKHDVEEFKAVVSRNGFWTSDLSTLAQAAINDKERPLLKGQESGEEAGENGESESTITPPANDNQNGEDWKSAPLLDAGIKADVAKKLRKEGIDTLGKLSAKMNEDGTWWYRSINGIGEESARKIEDLFAGYWKQHPEYCEAVKKV